jgi:phosphoserine phosphatase RsbU/P
LPNLKFKIAETYLESGDILLGYTDGVPEARAVGGEFFTNKRLHDILTTPVASGNILLNKITESVINHIGEADQFDDITLLAVQRSHSN